MKFKSDIEVQAGLKDSSGSSGSSGQILSSNGTTVSWTNAGSSVASDVQNQVKAGVAINKGQAVYVTSADGTNIIVGLASNTSEATSSKTLGLLNATVAINGFADVVQIGRLAGLDTTAATVGDPVWLGNNGNLIYGLANKPYAPLHLVFIGVVTRVNASNGEIFVNVQNGFELNEIHDVDIKTTVPINGDILGYNGTLWVNKTIAGWLGYTPVTNARTISTTAPLTGGGDLTANRTISMPAATTTVNGYLSAVNFTTFNNKQAALSGTGFVKISGTTISYDNSTYALDSAVVKLTGNQSITGQKTFNNSTTNASIFANNSSTGQAVYVDNTGGGVAMAVINSSTGRALNISNTTLATGLPLAIQKQGLDVFTVNDAGEATGTKFIKSGGTSSQFLMADGSVSTGSGGTVTSVAALTLGTTGTDLSSTVANGTTTPVITLNVPTASAANRGALSAADWTTFNSKQSALTFTAPLVNTTGTISMPAASTTVNGYLSAVNFTTFNNKQQALNGTGFVKASGTTISYDNSTYLTSAVTSIATSGAILGGTITTTGTISHSTADGFLHVPATGTTNNGKVLTAGATAGTFSWQTPTSGGVTSVSGAGGYGGLTLTGTVTTTGSLTLGGTPTGTWPISVSGNAATVSTSLTTTNADHYLTFVDTNNGSAAAEALRTIGTIKVNPFTGNFSAPIFNGAGTGLTGTAASLSIGGNAATATLANEAGLVVATSGGAVRSWDIRTISPSSMGSYRMGFGFTSLANNNTSPYADYLHLRSYTDASGGNDNLVMFNKSAIGMRIYQQTWGSSTAYASYKDIAFTDGSNSSGTWSISTSGNAGTATALQTARTIGGVSFNGTANINLPGVNTAGNQSTTGNAATATTLQTARTINGVSFNGSANITVADSTKLPLAGGTMTGAITFAAGQTWPTFNQNTTGNAATATTLQTARTINGVSFNGSANITVADSTKLPLSGGTMTGAITFAAGQTFPGGSNATTVNTGLTTTNATYYIPFTSTVNYSPAASTLGTVGTLAFNPNTGTLGVSSNSLKAILGGTVSGSTGTVLTVNPTFSAGSSTGTIFTAPAGASSTNSNGTNVRVEGVAYGTAMRFNMGASIYASSACTFVYGSTTVGTIGTSSTNTTYNTSSDYRLKENVVPMDGSIDRVKLLKPCNFNFIVEPEKVVDGFLAHEVQGIIPDAVTGEKDAINLEGNPVYQGIDHSKIVPLLTSALQEAISKIEELENRLSILEKK